MLLILVLLDAVFPLVLEIPTVELYNLKDIRDLYLSLQCIGQRNSVAHASIIRIAGDDIIPGHINTLGVM